MLCGIAVQEVEFIRSMGISSLLWPLNASCDMPVDRRGKVANKADFRAHVNDVGTSMPQPLESHRRPGGKRTFYHGHALCMWIIRDNTHL